MCSCQQHSNNASETAATVASDALAFKVEDMTCGHCAGTVKKAIEAGIPGTVVDADPATKIVSVRGKADFAAIQPIVIGAGYTPTALAAAH